MGTFIWLLLYVKCQHEAFSQPGSRVRVLKATLQSTGTQTGSASSSGALTGKGRRFQSCAAANRLR